MVINLYTINREINKHNNDEYSLYIALPYIKFLRIMAESHDNESIRMSAEKILLDYTLKNNIISDQKISILQSIQKKYLENIKNNPYSQKRIELINDRDARKNFYETFHLHNEANVALFRQMLFIRKEIAHRHGSETWAQFKTGEKTKNLLLWLYNLQKETSARAYRELSIISNEFSHSAIFAYDQKYFELLYKNKYTSFSLDSFVAVNCTLTFLTKKLGYTYQQMQISNHWTSSNISGNYQYGIYKNSILRGIILLDSSPRKGKPVTGFTEQLVVECTYSPENEVPVAYVSVSHANKCNYDDVKRLMHEFGHAFDIIRNSHKSLPFAKSGLNAIGDENAETYSQQMEIYVKNAETLSAIIMKPIDECKKIIAINNAFYNLDWSTTIAKAIYDLEIHNCTTIPSTKEIIDKYNMLIEQSSHVKQLQGICTVANFNHLADYPANYYVYLLGELRAPPNPPSASAGGKAGPNEERRE